MAKWSTTGFFLQCQFLINQTTLPVMRITSIINSKILWPTNLILMWREMKDSEERINSLKTILKLVKDRKSGKIIKYIPLQGSKTICSQILLALGKSWFTSTCIFLFSWRMTCPLSKWEWIETSLGQLDSTYFKCCCSRNGRRHLKNMAITLFSMDGFATHSNQHIHVQCKPPMIASFTKFHLFNKARKYDYWTISWFGKSFIRISLQYMYIVAQYLQLQDLFCLWPLLWVTSKDLNLGWLYVTMHEKYHLIPNDDNWQ